MNKSQVLEALAQTFHTDYTPLAVSLVGDRYEDLLQHTFLEVANIPEKKLIELFQNRQLRFFIIRIIQNQGRSVSSSYYKEVESFKTTELSGNYEGEQLPEYDIIIDRQAQYIRNLILKFSNWFDASVGNLHLLEGKTIAQISKRYGVNQSFIFQTLKRIKSSVRRRLEYCTYDRNQILDEFELLCDLYEKGKRSSNGRVNIHIRQHLLDYYTHFQQTCLINNVHSNSVMNQVYEYYEK